MQTMEEQRYFRTQKWYKVYKLLYSTNILTDEVLAGQENIERPDKFGPGQYFPHFFFIIWTLASTSAYTFINLLWVSKFVYILRNIPMKADSLFSFHYF